MAEPDQDKEAADDITEMASQKEMSEALREEELPLPDEAFEALQPDTTPLPEGRLTVASLRDRLAATLTDLLLLGYLYFGTLLLYNAAVWKDMVSPYTFQGNHFYLFHGLFALLAFLYFFLLEGVFFTSLGKFLARLSVRNAKGKGPSLFAIALRNLLRPIDLLLGILPTWILLEKTAQAQRLGDWLAGTYVMKHYSRSPTRMAVTGHTASASLRLLSGLIDWLFLGLWLSGLALWLDDRRPVLSLLILTLLPVSYLLWNVLWETIFQTSIGMWLFGLRLAQKEGGDIGYGHSLIRSVLRLFDTNPLGWLVMFLSAKNQKPSDLAADLVVVHAKRSWPPVIGATVAILLTGFLWLMGLSNPRNFLTPFFKGEFIARTFAIRIGGTPFQTAKGEKLVVKSLTFLESDRQTTRPTGIFKPGERIYLSFEVAGFTVRSHEAWLVEDLTIRYPDNSIGFKQENIVEFHERLKDPQKPLKIINPLILPANAQPGLYTLVLVLHDKLTDRHLTKQQTFQVRQ